MSDTHTIPGTNRRTNPKTALTEYLGTRTPANHRIIALHVGAPDPTAFGINNMGYLIHENPDTGTRALLIYTASKTPSGAQATFLTVNQDTNPWKIPTRFLDAAATVPGDHVAAWVERARANKRRLRITEAKERTAIGATIHLPEPINYGPEIGDVDTVRVVSPTKWETLDGTLLRTPPLWGEIEFTVTN